MRNGNGEDRLVAEVITELIGVSSEDVASAEPTEERKEREHEVGVLDYPERKLFFLLCKSRRETEQFLRERFAELTVDTSGNFGKILFVSSEKVRIIEEMLSISIRAKFLTSLLRNPDIDIRRGWVVVRVEPPAYETFTAWLEGIPSPPTNCGCASCKRREQVAKEE